MTEKELKLYFENFYKEYGTKEDLDKEFASEGKKLLMARAKKENSFNDFKAKPIEAQNTERARIEKYEEEKLSERMKKFEEYVQRALEG